MIDQNLLIELLRTTIGGNLHHREGQELEFKEQFNFAGLADYFRDFAAFSNNKGGYLIFGVSDSPRKLNGLSETSLEKFEKIDPEKITGFLLEIFSGNISWEQETFWLGEKIFGVFRILPANTKPIIAKKDEGKEQIIKNGDIYYRYGGRTQKIQYAELETIINKRIEQNNNQWLDLMSKIGRAGPSNAAILDTEKSIIEKGNAKILVIDEALASKLKFIKKGEFVEQKGTMALKLIGDVVPVDRIEVIRKVKENLLKEYPLSAKELFHEVRKKYSSRIGNQVWEAIKENDLKNNPDYSAYNFRNKRQEDEFKAGGELPQGIPSLYNSKAVDFIVNVIRSNNKKLPPTKDITNGGFRK